VVPRRFSLPWWRNKWASWQSDRRMVAMGRAVARQAQADVEQRPVVLFNVSTRLVGLSQNAAFQLLTGWALRLNGVPVVHFVCDRGVQPCVLGTHRDNVRQPPPCDLCTAYSRRVYTGAEVQSFSWRGDPTLQSALDGLTLDELAAFSYRGMPLGALVLPAARWILRRHHLPDDEDHRFLLRQYILSAWNVAQQFGVLLDRVQPQSVVVFNGIMYPEAAARWTAQQRGIRVITHEVAFQPFSAFFTEGQATAYPINIPDDFELTPEQSARLDAYLEQRFQGRFTMAGITFWPEMKGLDEAFLKRAAQFKQIVPVFTNVVFDTSQVHANVVFPHMFAWLDKVLEIIRVHPETLFVIRAHPDEMRPGKESRESVADWVKRHGVDRLPNVVFVDSREYLSSYELIQRSKFVMVYNSSIGLEAALLGIPVLCGGKARYTRYPVVFFPKTPEDYRRQAEAFLKAERVAMPPEFRRNARRFLYYQLFRVQISFARFLRPAGLPGYVWLSSFSTEDIRRDEEMRRVVRGVLTGDFGVQEEAG